MAATNLGNVAVVPAGTWSNTNTYKKNNLVANAGNMYIAKKDVPTGVAITNDTYWMLSASRGNDGDVTTAAMNTAISEAVSDASDELMIQIGWLDSRMDAEEAKITPINKGGTAATSASEARTKLGITPANIGAATSGHGHALSDSGITGILSIAKGGTGQNSASGARTALGLGAAATALGYTDLNSATTAQTKTNLGIAVSSTTTPATTPTLASHSTFELFKFGRLVNFHIRYSSTIPSGTNTDAAIIPTAYRPESPSLIPLAIYAADTTANIKAYVSQDGTVTVRSDTTISALVLSGSWITAS